MAQNEIAKAYVQIVPTATGIQGQLGSILSSEADGAGRQAGNTFTSSFAQTTASAANALAPVSAGAKNLWTNIVGTAAAFDEQMSRVQAISGAYGSDLQDLEDLALELGKNTRWSAMQVGEGLEYMGMAGWDAEEMIAGMPAVLSLATAAGEDLGNTSDIVTDALTALGLSADDTAVFADILAQAARKSNTNVSLMGDSFRYAAPQVGSLFQNAAGGSEQAARDLAIALGLMANAGIKGSQAGTSMRSILTNMSKPTSEVASAMDKLGLSLYDSGGNMYSLRDIMDQMRASFANIKFDTEGYNESLAYLNEQYENGTITEDEYNQALETLSDTIFKAADAQKASLAASIAGKYGLSGLLNIVSASDEEYQKLCDAIDSSSQAMIVTKDGAMMPLNEAIAQGIEYGEVYNGTAEAMAAIMEDNLNGSMRGINSRLETISISLGDKVMPLVETAADYLIKFLDWFNGLSDGTQTLIIGVIGVTAVAAPLLSIMSNMAIGIAAISSLTGPLAITHLPALGTTLSGLATGAFSAATTAIGGIVTALGGIAPAATIAAGALLAVYDVNALNSAAEEYKAAHSAHLNEINTALQSYEKLYSEQGKAVADEWAAMVYQIDTSGMDLEQAQQALINEIDSMWEGVPQSIWQGFSSGWDYYMGGGGGGGPIGLARDAMTGVVDTVKGVFGIRSPSTVFREIAEQLAAGFIEGTQSGSWDTARTGMFQKAETLRHAFDGIDTAYEATGRNAMAKLASGVNSGSEDAAKTFSDVASGLELTASSASEMLDQTMEAAGSNVMISMANSLATGFGEVNISMNDVIGNIHEWIGGLDSTYDAMESVGDNLMVGMANGIIESGQKALQAAVDAARAIVDAARDVFSVSSPSKVFKEIGGYLTEGLALGIEDGESRVLDATQKMSGMTIDTMISTGSITPLDRSGSEQSQLLALLKYYLPMLAQMEVTLNGAIVGQMAPGMDAELGDIAYHKAREVMA